MIGRRGRRHARLGFLALAVWASLGCRFPALAAEGATAAERIGPLPAPRVAEAPADVRRRLGRLAWFASHGQCREAAVEALELAAIPAPHWLPAGDGAYRSLGAEVAAQVDRFSAECAAVYHSLAEPLANARLAEATELRDHRLLRRVSADFPATAASVRAAWLAGDWALEQGDWRTARADWAETSRGLLRLDDSRQAELASEGITPAGVEVRRVLGLLRGGLLDEASRIIAGLADAAAGAQSAEAADRLKEELERARTWPAARRSRGDWPEYAGGATRANRSAIANDSESSLYVSVWSETLAASVDSDANDDAARQLSRRNLATPPESSPAVVGDVIAWQDRRGVHLRRLATGEPLGAAEAAYAWERPAAPPRDGPTMTIEQPQFAVAIVDGLVWAARSQAVASAVARRGAAEFVALEASPSARLQVRARLDGADERTVFASPPIVVDGVAAIVLCTPGDVWSLELAGFDRDDARLLWRVPLGAGATPALDQALEYPQAGLAAAEGIAVVSTNLGMVAAVRLADGRPLWLRTYDRALVRDDFGGVRFYNALPESPLIAGELAIAAPRDAARVTAWDLTTGRERWSTPLPGANARLLAIDDGVAPPRVLLAAERPWALRLADGELDADWGEGLWAGAGQGMLAQNRLLWPTAAGVRIVDAATCQPAGAELALAEEGGVNVFVAGEHLVAASRRNLAVFRRADAPGE